MRYDDGVIEEGVVSMEDVMIDVGILPEVIRRRIHGDRVRVREASGVISLIPIRKATPIADGLVGLLNDADIRSTDDIKDMRLGAT